MVLFWSLLQSAERARAVRSISVARAVTASWMILALE